MLVERDSASHFRFSYHKLVKAKQVLKIIIYKWCRNHLNELSCILILNT